MSSKNEILNPKKILLIEDDAMLVEQLSMVLRLEHYHVETATTGTDGMTQIESFRPDLILCDILIPDPDGREILEWLRSKPEYAHLPFIFLTALAEKSDIRNGMNKGADDYLCKPVDLDDVLAAISARFDRQSALEKLSTDTFDQDSFASFESLCSLGLRNREAEVLNWIAQGKSNPEIAIILSISPRTVDKHVENIFTALDIDSRGAAMLIAIETQLKARSSR